MNLGTFVVGSLALRRNAEDGSWPPARQAISSAREHTPSDNETSRKMMLSAPAAPNTESHGHSTRDALRGRRAGRDSRTRSSPAGGCPSRTGWRCSRATTWPALGHLANIVRERKHGDAAYFVWNTHINHTNVCVATCDFCAFAAKKGEPRAYTMGLPDIFANVAALPRCARCTSSAACTPDLPWSYFIDMMEGDASKRGRTSTSQGLPPRSRSCLLFHRLYRMGPLPPGAFGS